MIEKIWEKAPTDIVDYPFMMELLKGFKQPRQKLSSLLKEGVLIRVKKGLYVLGERYSRGLYSREMLANLIYGPSYVSLEFALSYYGLIPERVVEVTSMTPARNKKFDTPLGRFSYHYLRVDKYAGGVSYVAEEKGGFLIASKEKALADCVARHHALKTRDEVADYLRGLRIEESDLAEMSLKKIGEIAKLYRSPQVNHLKQLLKLYHAK